MKANPKEIRYDGGENKPPLKAMPELVRTTKASLAKTEVPQPAALPTPSRRTA
jgi:hypothetical protein